MAFDDVKVRLYLRQAEANRGHSAEAQWDYLYALRQSQDPHDDDDELAAAEHYAYARWQVGSGKTNEAVMIAQTLGYDVGKLVGYSPPIYAVRRLLGHTWSTPSTDSIKWGLRGCSDGAADKDKAEAQKAAAH